MKQPATQLFLRAAAGLLAVALLASCATREADSRAALDATRMLEQSRSLSRTYQARLGLAVAAADVAAKGFAKDGNNTDRLTYNQACTEIAYLSQKVALPVTLDTPAGPCRLEFGGTKSSGIWNPEFFAKLIPTAMIQNKALVAKTDSAGFGGTLVGVQQPPNPRSLLLPAVGVSAPVTAVVNTTPPAHPGGQLGATLTLYDSAKRDAARVAGAMRPLAADLTAPLGFYPLAPNLGIFGLLRPQTYLEKEGLFLLQPYDPKKIPLVMIHGLMSQPQMWLPVMAAIEKDPALRGKYQFWVFAYPTGNPIGYCALSLRKALASMYKVYPKSPDMVIVNHSLGGVITHLQVINTGNALVDGIFGKNAPKILALPADSPVKQALILKSNPRISRVVFVAAPHRGAPLAINPIAEWAASFIRLPGRVLSDIGTATLQAATGAAGIKGNFVPNSVSGLEPTSPLLIAMNTVPVVPPFHSIIGVAGEPKSPLAKTSDTVVPYWSSHLDAARSEKIVPYPHTAMFVKPEATDEIKRILRLHLDGSTSTAKAD